MRRTLKKIGTGIISTAFLLLICVLGSCKRDHLAYTTSGVVNMYSYLDQNQDDFSLFKQIVDKAGYASFLDTYGTYTMFASNNAGVTAYLQSQGKTSVDQIDEAVAKKIVAMSLVSADTIATNFFTDGKLRSPTTAGQYLVTGVTNVNNVSTITVNKQANLVRGNIRVGNGIIHVIDNILIAAEKTLAQTIAANPDYSIFRAALRATGFYDTLNVAPANNRADRKYLTVIAQTNAVFQAAGIADSLALLAKYSTGNPKSQTDSLWLFVANRIWPELSYMSDIAASTLHGTLAPNQQTTSQLLDRTVMVNYDFIGGVQEPGQALIRENSDVVATNGVIHSVAQNYTIIVREPTAVYFDVCDQPEIKRTPGLYKRPGRSVQFQPGTLSKVEMFGTTNYYVTYNTDATVPANYYVNNDWMNCGLRFRTGSNGQHAIEFETPVIIAGRYKIWVDYKQGSGSQTINTTFDGEPLPNIFNPNDALVATETEAQSLIKGLKSYSESPDARGNGHVGRLLGVVNITKTGPHKIKFIATAGKDDARQLNLDVIEFRPIDMDQIRPKIGRNGNLIY